MRGIRLVAQDSKGGERDGNLDDDRADRQEPDFALSLFVHGLPNAQGHGSIPCPCRKCNRAGS